MHENHPSKQEVKFDEVNLQSVMNITLHQQRFLEEITMVRKSLYQPLLMRGRKNDSTNKSCNLPTRAPRGGVLLLITLRVSPSEARSAAEQCPWRLGWPKVSYIVFTFIVHLKFSQERNEAFGPARKRLTPSINYMTCTSITYKSIYTPSPPHRTQEKASVFSTLSAYRSEEGGKNT